MKLMAKNMKRFMSLVLALCMVVVSLSGAIVVGAEGEVANTLPDTGLVADGHMENFTVGGGAYGYGYNGSRTIVDTDAHSLNKSLHVGEFEGGFSWLYVPFTEATDATKLYLLTAYVKVNNVSTNSDVSDIFVQFQKAEGGQLAGENGAQFRFHEGETNGEWVRAAAIFTGASVNVALIGVRSTDAYIDDISVVEIPAIETNGIKKYGDFEKLTTNDLDARIGWFPHQNDNTNEINYYREVTCADSHTGARSLKISKPGELANTDSIFHMDKEYTSNLLVGKAYELTAYIKVVGAVEPTQNAWIGNVQVEMMTGRFGDMVNINGNTVSQNPLWSGNTDGWQKITLRIEGHDQDIADLRFMVRYAEEVWFDDISIEVIPSVAKIGTVEYTTLADAFADVNEGETIEILEGTIEEGTIKLPATLKNVTIKGAANGASVLKNTTVMSSDGNSLDYQGITFDGVVFDNSRILVTGWRTNGVTLKDWTVTNCVFKNIDDTSTSAAVHFNVAANSGESVENFTFTNNVIDGLTGGNKSGVYIAGTGSLIFTGNVINNVKFRPILLQLADCDGIADNVVVENNTFSGSANGRLQIYGSEVENEDGTYTPTGTDAGTFEINENIFKDVTAAQFICTWGINYDTVDISKNYYDVDIAENPNKIYWNNEVPANAAELSELGVYPIYTELNEDGTINEESLTDYVVTGLAGDGTVENPYVISNLDELKWFANDVNSGNKYAGKVVKLTADIDLLSEEWTPIGSQANPFNGTFDGDNHTISNLVITGYNSYVGLFGWTNNGEIKNLTINNAKVSGRLGVGALTGCPYTSDYTNIKLTGHVEINGMAYVGGLLGRNAYGDLTDITIDVDSTSYVKANSVENDVAYRTYVGGVVGFMGENGHKLENITSNIDVTGSTCDVGGITGIAHYGNILKNVTCTGNVTIDNADELSSALEIGGIAGVWMNSSATEDVTFEDCAFTGELSSTYYTDGVATTLTNNDFANGGLVGSSYYTSGDGEMIIDYEAYIGTTLYETFAAAMAAAQDGDVIRLMKDVELKASVSFDKAGTYTIDGRGFKVVPAADTTATNSAFLFTRGGSDADAANANYTIKNIVFEGWATDHVVRLQGVTATVDNCTFQNNNQTGASALGLLTLTFVDATVTNCVFKDNVCAKAIDVNSWGDGSMLPVVIDECVFTNNTCSSVAVVYPSQDNPFTIKNSEFIENTVTTTGHAAVIYLGFRDDATVTGCLFKDNEVQGATVRVAGAIVVGYSATIEGNAFVGNTATVNGSTEGVAQQVAISTYHGVEIDVSDNYWNDGDLPVLDVDYTNFLANDAGSIVIDSYYTSYTIDENGNVVMGEFASNVELPTATVTDIPKSELKNDDVAKKLVFAKKFVADEVEGDVEAFYGEWYGDFVLTLNKTVTFNAASDTADGYLAGQYDAYSENWLAVPFEDVTLEAGQPLKIMEYAAGLLGEPGLKYTYAEIYNYVKEFNCGIYFTDEFMAANPDLEVTLELRIYNPANEEQSYSIGSDYAFDLILAKVGEETFTDLQAAVDYVVENGGEIEIVRDFNLNKSVKVTAGNPVVIDLAGHTIAGMDTTDKSFGLFNNVGNLTIKDTVGDGAITLEATINSGWNRYSSVISNNPGGKVTVESGLIEHFGGTDMAYGIDNLTNGKGTYAETIINGGTIKSPYRAIRQFLNGIEAQNILTVNGGIIEGANKSIWMQDPSKNANTGTLTVGENAVLKGDVYLSVTEGSTEWPVEVAIAAAALADGSEVLSNNVPSGYVVENNNGIYGVDKYLIMVTYPVGNPVYPEGKVEYYNNILEAVPYTTNCPRLEGATITLLGDVSGAGLRFMENDMVFDLNGFTYTITAGTGSQGTNTSGFQIRPEVTTNVIFKNGTIKVAEGAPVVWMFNCYATDFILENVTVDCTDMAWSYGSSCYVVVSREGDNVQFLGDTKIENFNSDIAGVAYNIGGTMTVGENVVLGGDIELGAGATLTAPAGLNVTTAEGYMVAYNNGTYTSVKVVAMVGDQYFASLQTAIDDANGEIVTLLAPITVQKGETLVIDLKGQTVSTVISTQLNKSYAMITNKGTLTITDSVGGGKLSLDYTADSFGYGIGLYTISNEGGTLTIEGGRVENLTTVSGSMYDAIDNNSTLGDTYLTITGGELYCGYLGIRQFANSTTYENVVTINGGKVEGGNSAIWMQNPGSQQPKADVVITDGYVVGRILVYESTEFAVAVSGGTFTVAVDEEYIVDGYELKENADGTFGVVALEDPFKVFYIMDMIPSTDADGNTLYRVGFGAGIDSLNYKAVGFDITVNGITMELRTTSVYDWFLIYNNDGTLNMEVDPAVLGGNYIFYQELDFPAVYDNTVVNFRPFYVTMDGEKVSFNKSYDIPDIYTLG